MEKQGSPKEMAETLSLLLKELGIAADLLFSSLENCVTALRSGRSPRAFQLEEKLYEARGCQEALLETLQESQQYSHNFLERAQTFASAAEAWRDLPAQMSLLKEELDFWNRFASGTECLLKSLERVAEQEQLSALGRVPIEEAWEAVETLVQHKKDES